MKAKTLAFAAILAMGASSTWAAQFSCKVYCVSPSGSTTVTVQADSSSSAASIVDKQSDAICRAAGYGKSTSATMSSSQCTRN